MGLQGGRRALASCQLACRRSIGTAASSRRFGCLPQQCPSLPSLLPGSLEESGSSPVGLGGSMGKAGVFVAASA